MKIFKMMFVFLALSVALNSYAYDEAEDGDDLGGSNYSDGDDLEGSVEQK